MLCRDFSAEAGAGQPGEQDSDCPTDQPGDAQLSDGGAASSLHLLVQRWQPHPQPFRDFRNQGNLTQTLAFIFQYFILSDPARFVNLKSYLKVCMTTHVSSFFVNDTGVYSCISRNIAGSVARFIDLQYEPLGKPHFILKVSTLTSTLNNFLGYKLGGSWRAILISFSFLLFGLVIMSSFTLFYFKNYKVRSD